MMCHIQQDIGHIIELQKSTKVAKVFFQKGLFLMFLGVSNNSFKNAHSHIV